MKGRFRIPAARRAARWCSPLLAIGPRRAGPRAEAGQDRRAHPALAARRRRGRAVHRARRQDGRGGRERARRRARGPQDRAGDRGRFRDAGEGSVGLPQARHPGPGGGGDRPVPQLGDGGRAGPGRAVPDPRLLHPGLGQGHHREAPQLHVPHARDRPRPLPALDALGQGARLQARGPHHREHRLRHRPGRGDQEGLRVDAARRRAEDDHLRPRGGGPRPPRCSRSRTGSRT